MGEPTPVLCQRCRREVFDVTPETLSGYRYPLCAHCLKSFGPRCPLCRFPYGDHWAKCPNAKKET
jgi:hypothetical protein